METSHYDNPDTYAPFPLTRLRAIWLLCMHCLGTGKDTLSPMFSNRECGSCKGRGQVKVRHVERTPN